MDFTARTLRSLLTWPVATQQGARRNALVASTALTERRRERQEVEDFLTSRGLPAVTATPESLTRHVI